MPIIFRDMGYEETIARLSAPADVMQTSRHEHTTTLSQTFLSSPATCHVHVNHIPNVSEIKYTIRKQEHCGHFL